jgi:hypothetical protein
MKSSLSQQGECTDLVFLCKLTSVGMRKLSTGELVLCASGAGALGGLAGNPAGTFLVMMERVALTGRYHPRANGSRPNEGCGEATWLP